MFNIRSSGVGSRRGLFTSPGDHGIVAEVLQITAVPATLERPAPRPTGTIYSSSNDS
ncbi:hypothetical protein ACFW0V_18360 [Micromonospora parva]|uniref:hypothetical protein n=1 Tax=Micromonospora parva TaxID=1464048 RepID=UPI0036707970